MKRNIMLISSLFIFVLMMGSVFAYQGNSMEMKGKGYGKNQGGQTYTLYDDTQVNHQAEIDMYPIEELSQEEINGLLLMREEEKLARDVYLGLYDIFGQQIFSNIAKSEATHTNAVKSLLDKYDIADPMTNDIRGVFEDQDLQDIYDQLIDQGSSSLLDALKVGATVEDLDIKDLQELNEVADNQDITEVYNNLEKGSRNHLRSFTKLIEKNGGTYEAQYISEEDYNAIIAGDMETGSEYASTVNGGKKDNGGRNTNDDAIQKQSKNIFSRMWNGFKGWFS